MYKLSSQILDNRLYTISLNFLLSQRMFQPCKLHRLEPLKTKLICKVNVSELPLYLRTKIKSGINSITNTNSHLAAARRQAAAPQTKHSVPYFAN